MFKALSGFLLALLLPLTLKAQAVKFSPGEAVTTGDYQNAIVQRVLANGKVEVAIDGFLHTYDMSQLHRRISCLRDICENQPVTTDGHYNAIVSQVFPDGLVKIYIGSQLYNYKINQLFRPIFCYGNICPGDTVATDGRYLATVLQVFPDGLTKVLVDNFYFEYWIWQLQLVRKCQLYVGGRCVQ